MILTPREGGADALRSSLLVAGSGVVLGEVGSATAIEEAPCERCRLGGTAPGNLGSLGIVWTSAIWSLQQRSNATYRTRPLIITIKGPATSVVVTEIHYGSEFVRISASSRSTTTNKAIREKAPTSLHLILESECIGHVCPIVAARGAKSERNRACFVI